MSTNSFTDPQTTGTTMYNQAVLNIIDLQNVADPGGGGNTLSNQVATLTQQLATLTANTAAASTSIPFNSTDTETVLSNSSALSYDLRVYGTVYASNYNSLCPLVFTAGKKEAMWITEEGGVGIGVSAPRAHLHVGGNILIDGGGTFKGTTTFTDAVVF
jgi:hypothetical protein